MIKGKSKFTFDNFSGGYDDFAVSQQRYTKEQAIKLYLTEGIIPNGVEQISVGRAFVRHGYGRNEDNEPCSCWWLEYNDGPRSVPAWVFHITANRRLNDGYEIINIREGYNGN